MSAREDANGIRERFDKIHQIMRQFTPGQEPRGRSAAAMKGWETRRWRRFREIFELLNRSKSLADLHKRLVENHAELRKWQSAYPKYLELPVFTDRPWPKFFEDFIASGFNIYSPHSQPDSWDDSRFLAYVWELDEWLIYDEKTVREMVGLEA